MDLENQSGWWFFTTNPSEQYAKTVKNGWNSSKNFRVESYNMLELPPPFFRSSMNSQT